jgi:hypothetical protein
METVDQLAGSDAGGRIGEDQVVRDAVENRDVPQDSQIGLPRRASQASNCGAFEQVDRGILHFELAGILDDHDPKNSP